MSGCTIAVYTVNKSNLEHSWKSNLREGQLRRTSLHNCLLTRQMKKLLVVFHLFTELSHKSLHNTHSSSYNKYCK